MRSLSSPALLGFLACAFACSCDATPGDGGGDRGATSGGAGSVGPDADDGPGSSNGGSGELFVGLTLEEDSPSLCGFLGTVEAGASGYTGLGYLSLEARRGAGVSWVVRVETEGDYELIVRYASDADKAGSWRVAHQAASQVSFPSTQGAANWQEQTTTVHLKAGAQHLSLVSAGATGLPAIDSLALGGNGLSESACEDYSPGSNLAFTAPTFQNVSVHDPSVVFADGQSYVFGSHLAAAKTSDLMHWSLVAGDGVNANNPLFDNVVTELAQAFTWSEVVGLWAADVLQLESSGRYLMYYNSCKGSEPRSALGIASSTDVEGPYEDEGIFLYSGMWGEESPDGAIYNPQVHPNAIDPDAFYDRSGSPWMVYGSYSGGIFIVELDPLTGRPKPGQGYGKHLLGGNHAPIEGPYIQYVPESGYYYLFTSYGGLDANGGYNLRVARATAPDGPYLDANGIDQATVKADPTVPLFDTVTIAPSGVKLFGNHVWAETGGARGYVSAGHNSAFHDAATGKTYLIFHSRFPGQGEAHQVRVHELFVNVDGWLVAAPLRYAPRLFAASATQAEAEYVGRSEVAGSYQVVNHAKDISSAIKTSEPIAVSPDGSISGSVSGNWTFGGDNVAVFTLEGVAFRGVLSRQWSEHAEAFQVTFSGMNDDGVALWAIRTGD